MSIAVKKQKPSHQNRLVVTSISFMEKKTCYSKIIMLFKEKSSSFVRKECLLCQIPREKRQIATPLWYLVVPPIAVMGYRLIIPKRHISFEESLTEIEKTTLQDFKRHVGKVCQYEIVADTVIFMTATLQGHLCWRVIPEREANPPYWSTPIIITSEERYEKS